jgi:hypothetical protein
VTDQELLELAAKATQIDHGYGREGTVDWNPLTDDSDAFKLAVKLKMIIDPYFGAVALPPLVVVTVNNGDIYAATRRAIVQIAAEIGKGVQDDE